MASNLSLIAEARRRRRKREQDALSREQLVQDILKAIPVPKDGREGRDGRDAPELQEIVNEVLRRIPEPTIQQTVTEVREELDMEKVRRLIQEELPEIRTPEIQVIREEVNLDTSEFITSKDFNNALRRIDQAIQNNRGGGIGPREVPLDNFQFISSASDFPSARNGVITLAPEKAYFICGDVDLLGKRLVLGEDTCILGASSENASLTSTGLDPNLYMIETDWTFPCRHITFKSVSKAIGVNLNNTSTDTNLALDWTGVNFSGCTINVRCGDIDNFIYDKGAVLGSGSFEFFGEAGTIGIANSLFVGDGSASNLIAIESTANITRRFRTIYSSFVAFGSTTAIDFSSSATVNNEAYILDTCNFSGGSTYLSGVDHTDNKALFVNNVGISNSADVSQYYMNGNTTATVISSKGVEYKVAGSTTSSSVTSKFTNTDNRATYVGALTRFFKVTATMSLTSGNGNQIGAYIAKNGTIVGDSEIYVTTNAGGRAENVMIQTLVQLTGNDYVEIFVENNTAANNITVTDLNVIVE